MQKMAFKCCIEHQILVLPIVVFTIFRPPCNDVPFLSWIYIFPVPFSLPLRDCVCSQSSLWPIYACSLFHFTLPSSQCIFFALKRLRPCPVNILKTHTEVRTYNRNTSSSVIGYMYVTALEMLHAWTRWMFRGFQGADGFGHVTFYDIISTKEQEAFRPTNKNINS